MMPRLSREDLESTVCDRFVWRGGSRFRCVAVPLPHAPFADSPTRNAPCLLFATRIRACASGEGGRHASSDNKKFLLCVRRQRPKRVLASMFQDEGDRFSQVGQAFLTRFALAVGAWDFGAVGDVPRLVSLNDRSELIAHILSLSLSERRLTPISARHLDVSRPTRGGAVGRVIGRWQHPFPAGVIRDE